MRFGLVTSVAFMLMQQHIGSKIAPCLCDAAHLPPHAIVDDTIIIPAYDHRRSAWDNVIEQSQATTQQQTSTNATAIAESHDVDAYSNSNAQASSNTLTVEQCLQAFPDLRNPTSTITTSTYQPYTTSSYYTTSTYTPYTPTPTTTSYIQPTSTSTSTPTLTPTMNCPDQNSKNWVDLCNFCDKNPTDKQCTSQQTLLPTVCPTARQMCGVTRRRRQVNTMTNSATISPDMRPLCAQLVSTSQQQTSQPQTQPQPQQQQQSIQAGSLGVDHISSTSTTSAQCTYANYSTQYQNLAKLPKSEQDQQLQAMAAKDQAGRDTAYCLQFLLSYADTVVASY